MEIKWGLVPDMSLTQTLRDIVPLDVAKELTFTGRILSGAEAKELGLVTRVAEDPLAAAMALAQEIAGKSPDAIRAGKRLLEESWHADERTGLELESKLQVGLMGQPNQVEAVKANFENRPPVFKDAAA
jgi:enoyl-CoA hydratase/carnithine racemase